ncbi:tRNA (N(6)-L-threonylcarbamoyladenosine(37)-C(2))-methylthiotransferase MtaB [Leptospira sp. GIMC2001]|uniref:tRNA (N(6)-L-threonylcarbamoyladenosine(37)-C(2))- methylthiotransferase MtaB n=1 Tax=Leptospira sp. GIMC2001 TaxID=1513297 RepID=UPI00234B4606|nr:tRNA (N(6)-L-threonylcarbamoyladenosine(37)-C(2))-methylthiotransferase MtaB [Leptospira sp. GIMC2001]WCL48698.1 tRNA (N(6)-L-threonylcarbamoyladenosine(37)-C(2))-methylthiotransferase MtaB [Leptospira sp. GIMC2001]
MQKKSQSPKMQKEFSPIPSRLADIQQNPNIGILVDSNISDSVDPGSLTKIGFEEPKGLTENKKVAVHTLGCRLNFFETDGILSVLKENGYAMADVGEHPSDIIINTCTVTNRADVKNRNIIRSAIKKFPGANVWVTGCYAQTDREVLESIPGVAGVFGNTEKSALAYKILGHSNPVNLDRFSYSDVLPEGHTRAYLKVQDGCNRVCSYCKIPQARGAGVSRGLTDILDQVKYIQDHGVGEIILTGVNLGWYRDANGQKSFIPLLESILKILDYSRLRLSSLEPPDLGHDLVDLISHPRFCKFLHIPIQSGSRKILKSMRRTYNPDSFRKRIELAKSKFPNIFLGTDVITGFPGESDFEFNETVDLLRELEFTKIHAFPYSVRKNTEAERLGDSVPHEIKKQRVLELMHLSREWTKDYILKRVSSLEEAILEKDGTLVTDSYIKGRLADQELKDKLLAGQFLDVEIVGILDQSNANSKSSGKEVLAELRIRTK